MLAKGLPFFACKIDADTKALADFINYIPPHLLLNPQPLVHADKINMDDLLSFMFQKGDATAQHFKGGANIHPFYIIVYNMLYYTRVIAPACKSCIVGTSQSGLAVPERGISPGKETTRSRHYQFP